MATAAEAPRETGGAIVRCRLSFRTSSPFLRAKIVNRGNSCPDEPGEYEYFRGPDQGLPPGNIHADESRHIQPMEQAVQEEDDPVTTHNGHDQRAPQVNNGGGYPRGEAQPFHPNGAHGFPFPDLPDHHLLLAALAS